VFVGPSAQASDACVTRRPLYLLRTSVTRDPRFSSKRCCSRRSGQREVGGAAATCAAPVLPCECASRNTTKRLATSTPPPPAFVESRWTIPTGGSSMILLRPRGPRHSRTDPARARRLNTLSRAPGPPSIGARDGRHLEAGNRSGTSKLSIPANECVSPVTSSGTR